MDEPTSSETLIDYHFGTLSAEAAARVEERLLADGDLLRAYLRLKRQLDGSALLTGPSPEVRDRLRRAVGAAYGPGGTRSLRRWLQRPMPRYQTLAVAAAVAVVMAVMGLLNPGPSPAPATGGRSPAGVFREAGPVVDSARTRPASLEVF